MRQVILHERRATRASVRPLEVYFPELSWLFMIQFALICRPSPPIYIPSQWIYKFTLDKGTVSYLNAHQWACCTSLLTMSGVTMNRDGGHFGSEVVVVVAN